MEWWLQSFKRKPKTGAATYGYKAGDITRVRNKLSGRIQAHTVLASLGFKDNSKAAPFNTKLKDKCYVNTFSIKNWIMQPSTRNALLAGFAEEIISEFFDTELDEVNLEVPDTCAVSS